MAECCCELKEKIDSRANQTETLINSIEKDRLRDALQSCKTESLVNSILAARLKC